MAQSDAPGWRISPATVRRTSGSCTGSLPTAIAYRSNRQHESAPCQARPIVRRLNRSEGNRGGAPGVWRRPSTRVHAPSRVSPLSPRLLAGWGDDRERYESAASLQALAGTSPVAYASGNYAHAHRRHACVKPFRNSCTSMPGSPPFRNHGLRPITGASAKKVRVTAWRCAPWQMFGCGSSTPCGSSALGMYRPHF